MSGERFLPTQPTKSRRRHENSEPLPRHARSLHPASVPVSTCVPLGARSDLSQSCRLDRGPATSGQPRSADISSSQRDVSRVPILLQKSFWGVEGKFLEPLRRFKCGDVRDHIVSSKIDQGPPWWH
jgi:hypothetical protein